MANGMSPRMQRSPSLWDEGLRRAAPRWRGIGIVMLPEIMVSEDIACGRLVRLLLGYAPPTATNDSCDTTVFRDLCRG